MTVDVTGVPLTGADLDVGAAGRGGDVAIAVGQGVVAGEVAEGDAPLEVLVLPVGTPDVKAHHDDFVAHGGVGVVTGAALDLLHVVMGTVSAEFSGRQCAGSRGCEAVRSTDTGVPRRIAVT